MRDWEHIIVLLGCALLGALYGVLRAYARVLAFRARRESRELRLWQSELEMCAHDVRTQSKKNLATIDA